MRQYYSIQVQASTAEVSVAGQQWFIAHQGRVTHIQPNTHQTRNQVTSTLSVWMNNFELATPDPLVNLTM